MANVNGMQQIDITENMKQMKVVVDRSCFGTLNESVKTKSGFAVAGAAAFFFYAIAKQYNWVPYTICGLIAGGLVGYAVDKIVRDDKADEVVVKV